jgi:hypothetical protein
MTANKSLETLRLHERIMLRCLRDGPLTEFELTHEVAQHSGITSETAAESIGEWLESLRDEGLIWMGQLENANGQRIYAAALTLAGRELLRL